ncbi:hypothetical protein PybrP1_008042 [[Pythium] brassicae (nom. inval.)]|nr:hypothetical protein PybrP1_008042 [[Pythium] brassicae (nom. inval.)]
MDRENTPLKQRQKRGGNGNRRSSTSSASASAANGKSSSAASVAIAASSSSAAAASGAAATSGASARAFRVGTRVGAAPSATILSKHPPTILKAAPALYNPDAPPVMRASPPPAPQTRYSEVPVGYLHVNTRQQQQLQHGGGGGAPEHAQLYGRHSVGGGDGPARTLYQPPPSSSPGVKKMVAPAAAGGPHAPTLLRPAVATAGDAHASSLVAPPTSVKLITPQYQFATDLSGKLSGCLELTGFTVVGVLGFDGVGKSTLLSLLHSSADSETAARKPSPRTKRAAASRSKSLSGASSRDSEGVFAPRGLDKLVAGDYETAGVDLAVSHDPTGASGASLVLLDSQPMLSSAMLCELLGRNESPRFGALTPEQQVEAHSLQLATFLLSVCHYVVIAHDALADLAVARFLQHAAAKLQLCRLPHISGGVKDKHVAKLLFVATRVADAALRAKEQPHTLRARHERALETAWPGAFFRPMSPLSGATHNGNAMTPPPDTQLPWLVLPPKPPKGKVNSRAQEGYDDAAAKWRKFVQRLPNAPSFSKNPATHHTMTLREWLSNASRVFESVRKSGAFTAEFHGAGRDHH